uniref:Uncharacterized protein n=1 Tax=Cyanistes caeruleus TaxID=156563 RepID=A0A8C0U9T5_CYACU
METRWRKTDTAPSGWDKLPQREKKTEGKIIPTPAATMPDSPADVKTQARSTPPSMPPPPAATQGATRHPSFTPSTSDGRSGSAETFPGHACVQGFYS